MYILSDIALFTRATGCLPRWMRVRTCAVNIYVVYVWVHVYLISFRCFVLDIRMLCRRISRCPPTKRRNVDVAITKFPVS